MIWHFRRSGQQPDLPLMLKHAVYAPDSATIDLCLSMFDWRPFAGPKPAAKPHTVLDLRGSIPTFIRCRRRQVPVFGHDLTFSGDPRRSR
jgi:hypothetical protein